MKKWSLFGMALLLLMPMGARAQFAWYGADGTAQVKTGLGDGSDTEGLWWFKDDSGSGGHSKVIWPDEITGNTIDDVIVTANGGIGGEAQLDKGDLTEENPYIEIGFNIAGEDSYCDPIVVDASSWRGIAIAYTSDVAPYLILGMSESTESSIGNANPAVALPKSTAGNFKRLLWSDFQQPSWYSGVKKIDGPTAATQLAYIGIRIQSTPGLYSFNVTAIGSYDMEDPKDHESHETPTYNDTCATPTIAFANGKLLFGCKTQGVDYHYSIQDDDITNGIGNKVSLTATYRISVYAFKENYANSDTVQATLCWIDQQPVTEGITEAMGGTEVSAVKTQPVIIQSQGGSVSVIGAEDGTPVYLYGTDGKEQGSAIADKGSATIANSLQPGSMAILKIGENRVKVLIK